MTTDIEKDLACKEHEKVIKAIYYIGNKVMLLSQLYEVLDIIYGQTRYSIDKALKELEELEIIKFEQYLDTKYKLIILKKHAIKCIEKKATTQEVAAVPKKSTERALYSAIKTDMFLEKIRKFKGKEINLKHCKKYLDSNGCSIMYHKNQGSSYIEKSVSKIDSYNHENGIANKTFINKSARDKNLVEGSKMRLGKGTQGKERVSTKNETSIGIKSSDGKVETKIEKEVNRANMDTVLNGNIFISHIEKNEGKTVITLELHDMNNTQNWNRFLEKALISCHVFSSLFKEPVHIKFNIKLLNKVAVNKGNDVYINVEKGTQYPYYTQKLLTYRKATGSRESIFQGLGFTGKNRLSINLSCSALTKYRTYGD